MRRAGVQTRISMRHKHLRWLNIRINLPNPEKNILIFLWIQRESSASRHRLMGLFCCCFFFTIFCLCWEFKHLLCSGHLEIQWRNSQSAVSQHQARELDSSERRVGYTPTLTHTPAYGPFTLKAPAVPSPQVTRRRARL